MQKERDQHPQKSGEGGNKQTWGRNPNHMNSNGGEQQGGRAPALSRAYRQWQSYSVKAWVFSDALPSNGGDGLVELVVRRGQRKKTEIQDEKALAGDSSKGPCSVW